MLCKCGPLAGRGEKLGNAYGKEGKERERKGREGNLPGRKEGRNEGKFELR